MVLRQKKEERMEELFSRTIALIGEEAQVALSKKKVAVFGLGGVGSFAVEALARTGIGHLLLVDKDVVDRSNCNRQLYALHSTIGMQKTKVAAARCRDINPDIQITEYPEFYQKQGQIPIADCDYIIDAIDTVTAKLLLITEAKQFGLPVISCMGTGNKLDPSQFMVTDIAKTHTCPLAKVMRKELKERGIDQVKVVFSTAEPVIKRQIPASISFVPPVAGLLLAAEVIRDFLTEIESNK